MDPITIFGTAAGAISVIDVLARCIVVLEDMNSQFKTANLALLSLATQLRALSAALVKIQAWTERHVEEIHHQLAMDLKDSVSCCQLLVSKVHSELNGLHTANGGPLSFTSRARYVFKKKGISELETMIDRQASTLTLLLTACNSDSLTQQHEIISDSKFRKRIEVAKRDTASLQSLVDSASFLSRRSEGSSKLSLLFEFDDELFGTIPYKRMIRKAVKVSLRPQKEQVPFELGQVTTTITSAALKPISETRDKLFTVSDDSSNSQPSEKILLLGIGEASKTTFLKQIQSLYQVDSFNESRMSWISTIYDNMISNLKILAQWYKEYLEFLGLHNTKSRILSGIYFAISASSGDELSPNFADEYKYLFETLSSNGTQYIRFSFDIPSNLEYYAKNLERICSQDFIPTDQDIMHARVRTTGLHKYPISVGDHTTYIVDVGGERSERKKWRNVFDKVTNVIFLASMSCYNENLYEDHHTNRMQETLMLFESISNSRWFDHSKISLCFTMMDLFSKKIESGWPDIKKYFSDYEGDSMDSEAVKQYITNQFLSLAPRTHGIELFYINATDQEDVKGVMANVLSADDFVYDNDMTSMRS
ncbi:G-alpha-domain-containing protein [Corynespora cassiicola Philippines]|uniref:G-alpha-domain-containing protein n=1 Tax=Corynespora cassiicola Philippines TaxID=1448308 RepID=A0A2T2NWM9_CORCC|nr:G-alpha-domain-containing protein [Corynespora cassiicola Philippines]